MTKESAMESSFIEWIVNQTGIAAFAAFALWINHRQYGDGVRRERENAETQRVDKQRVSDALEGVTKSNTELCHLIRELRDDMRQERTE